MTSRLPAWLRRICLACTDCPLHKTRRNVVICEDGCFPQDVTIAYIGEAPGRSEDMLGVPFIGVSGKLFQSMRGDAGVESFPRVVVNTVMCRPCDEKEGDNREPRKEEAHACHDKIVTVLTQYNPAVLVFVGAIAKRYFGRLWPELPRFSIPHPSYVLRSGGKSSPAYLECVRTLEDVRAAYLKVIKPVLTKGTGD